MSASSSTQGGDLSGLLADIETALEAISTSTGPSTTANQISNSDLARNALASLARLRDTLQEPCLFEARSDGRYGEHSQSVGWCLTHNCVHAHSSAALLSARTEAE